MSFTLTYASMANPPDIFHTSYETALAELKTKLGKDYPLIIGDEKRFKEEKFPALSPINRDWTLASFQSGDAQDAQNAVAAAKAAFPAWSKLPWQERVAYVRKFAQAIQDRIFEIGAAVSLDVGKNRMEALADVQEAVDLLLWPCKMMEQADGYQVKLANDPMEGVLSVNESHMVPHGVWLVITPFNFPAALACGPMGNALVAGNTVVLKPASDSAWATAMMMECAEEAGFPSGVINYLTGPGGTLGNALIDHPDIAGVTFTGSAAVGLGINRKFAEFKYPRPVVLELGGKNATIVSKNADIADAALGCMRSAFGLQGQKCSANSRIFVEREVYQAFVEELVRLTKEIKIGDPTMRENWFGTVINERAAADYEKYIEEFETVGRILTGGKRLTDGDLAKGLFCAPTIVVDVPMTHYLWKHEMFLPITMVTAVDSLEEAMGYANDTDYGLTAGFMGSAEEGEWFLDNIQAGVCYVNRVMGSTTGAWPGFQPFGGWKASGSTGRNTGGPYALLSYMREQSRTRVSIIE